MERFSLLQSGTRYVICLCGQHTKVKICIELQREMREAEKGAINKIQDKCNAMQSGRNYMTFRRKVLIPSPGTKSMQNNQHETSNMQSFVEQGRF